MVRMYFIKKEMQLGPNADSGFDKSIADSKDGLKYISPLPPAADRVSCDGKVFMCYQMVRRIIQQMRGLNPLCLLH